MEEENDDSIISSEFPPGRVKRIVNLDIDIKKVSSEALFLISISTNLFLQFLAEKSMQIASEKKRKTIKVEYLRLAAKRHSPTSDFLLDSLPMPSEPSVRCSKGQTKSSARSEKPLPAGAQRIDDFFRKSAGESVE